MSDEQEQDWWDQLTNLKKAAKRHIAISKNYLPILRNVSHPYGSTENPSPWKTLTEGVAYLGSAYNLIEVYKNSIPGPIENDFIQSINNTLTSLEFNPTHIKSGCESFFQGRVPKYYQLLQSELKQDISTFITTVEQNIDQPVQRFLGTIKDRLKSCLTEKFLWAIKNNKYSVSKVCIKRGVTVNSKDNDGKIPLHHAVERGNVLIVKLLLSNNAKVNVNDNNGYTPLHIASSKGNTEIVKLLLQFLPTDSIDDKTIWVGTTSLHIAAKNGFFEIVKCLLKHKATYNVSNNVGKTPVDLSNNVEIVGLLNLIDKFFKDIKNAELREVKSVDEFLAITNARNEQGKGLLSIAIDNGHEAVACQLLKMIFASPDQVESWLNPEYQLGQLERLRWALEDYIRISEVCLIALHILSDPYGSEENLSPWETLKDGSYYLSTVSRLVQLYKDDVYLSMTKFSLQSVKDTLVELGFDSKHITSGYTSEAYGGKVECFVSKGQGKKYYTLLHSGLSKDVRSFVEMIESNIDKPVKRFLKEVDQRLHAGLADKLIGYIENNNFSGVEDCLKRGVIVHLVKKESNTLLHLATLKGNTEIIELLLVYARKDKRINLINAKTSSGDTSLHLAVVNGFIDVVGCLLKYGASLNILNGEGKTPVEVTNDRNIVQLFEDGVFESLDCKLEKLKCASEKHINASLVHIAMLRGMLEDDSVPWESLKEGAYYLENAYRLVEVYKDCVPGPIDEENIRSVRDTLTELEFDPRHIKSGSSGEALGKEMKYFCSQSQVPKYYTLLHSETKENIRLFLEIVERDIDKPVERFLKLIEERLKSG